MPTKHSDEILKAALVGFEQQRAELAARISELKQMLAGGAKLPAAKGAAKEDAVPKKKRRRLSAGPARGQVRAHPNGQPRKLEAYQRLRPAPLPG